MERKNIFKYVQPFQGGKVRAGSSRDDGKRSRGNMTTVSGDQMCY